MRVPPTLKRPYAPLIWVVLGLMAGYGVAEVWPEGIGSVAGWTGAIILTAVAIGVGIGLRRLTWVLNVAVMLATAGLGAIYYHAADTRQTDITASPTEAEVVVRIKQRFAIRAESGRASGLGEIISVSPDLGEVRNNRIHFSTRWMPQEAMQRESTVRMVGLLQPVEPDSNGFANYLERSHVQWSLTRAIAQEVVRPAPLWMQGIEKVREASVRTLRRSWGQENGLLSAMVIGAKAEISKQQKENFVRSGTMHLLAISGLNVMVVAAGFLLLGKALGLRGATLAIGVAAATWIYAQVAGAAPSVMRAWGMVAVGAVGIILRRQLNVWSVLVLTAVISLLVEPLSLWHAGWRLSFGVVAGMVLGMNAIERIWPMHRLPKWGENLAKAVLVSIVAGIAVAPMTAVYFGLAQPWGWALNTVSVVIASWVTLLGMASLLLGWLPGVPELLNTVANWLLGVLESAIGGYLHLPGGVLEVHPPLWVESVGTLLILLVFYTAARWWPRRIYF